VLGEPNDPWQEWLSIHVGELLEDGRPRFRTVLILIARQQGKTTWARKLTLFWLFILQVGMVLGTSTDRQYAKASWAAVCEMAQGNEYLADEMPAFPVRKTIGEECLTTIWGSKYRFAASNGRAGRSLTIDRLLLDELREHNSFETWNAATYAMNAVYDAQVVAISNQGDNGAVVLDSLRLPAIEYIETGKGDERLGLFEWSAPQGSDPEDLQALAMACPDLGRRTDPYVLLAAARKAKAAGGEELTGFKTEVMCMRVDLLDPAIEPDKWEAAGTDTPIKLSDHRDRVALCFDVSLDGSHATLMAAALLDGKLHVEVVEQWDGHGCTQQLRREMPALVRKIKPRCIGWFPQGPAAAIAADLATKRGAGDWWPPSRVKLEEITSEITSVCMGLADLVLAGEVVHPKDPLLDQHVASAQKLYRGDRWVFTRKATGPIDGAYSVAGAVHLARLLPPPLSPVTVA
jgi:phage terminase large subunit-like protein